MVKYLQQEYLDRCRKNEQYSLRSFARSLNTPVSTLSEILNERRPLSTRLRNKFGTALGLPPETIQKYKAKDHGNKQVVTQEEEFSQLALDSFYIISDWYHYGVLQLMRTKDFLNDPIWIARRLGIKVLEANLALARLKRVGILEETTEGKLIDVTNGSTTHLKNNFTSDELRNFQIKAIEKAIGAMRSVPVTKRDNTSMTMAISKKAIPFAKEEIKKFRRSLTKKLEGYAEPDEVYQLAISLTPLTILENDEEIQ
jgi:uncharacterized protein (TIGR02147 family)